MQSQREARAHSDEENQKPLQGHDFLIEVETLPRPRKHRQWHLPRHRLRWRLRRFFLWFVHTLTVTVPGGEMPPVRLGSPVDEPVEEATPSSPITAR